MDAQRRRLPLDGVVEVGSFLLNGLRVRPITFIRRFSDDAVISGLPLLTRFVFPDHTLVVAEVIDPCGFPDSMSEWDFENLLPGQIDFSAAARRPNGRAFYGSYDMTLAAHVLTRMPNAEEFKLLKSPKKLVQPSLPFTSADPEAPSAAKVHRDMIEKIIESAFPGMAPAEKSLFVWLTAYRDAERKIVYSYRELSALTKTSKSTLGRRLEALGRKFPKAMRMIAAYRERNGKGEVVSASSMDEPTDEE